ncbi:class I SAM-dependent methyltransferase [Pseudolysinimonas sp.]|uniref:class I SAM-dependent methyltransferase n=1 Tax=Pseudolysinimonas sp. TaxID=2680009 RepID=UPI003F7D2635
MTDVDYLALNRANWDDRAEVHAASAGYDLARYRDDPRAISDVVSFDRPLLGDVAGLDAVHLQCHIGTDTLSLARLGARMTGLDLSPTSLRVARELAASAGADIPYVESDVYGAVDALGAGRFDLVYVSVGAICWLPSVARWAATVAALLRPGGRLFIRDGHPVLLAVGEEHPERLELEYPYFEMPEPMVWDQDGTYVDADRPLTATRTAEWNHGLGEIVTAVLASGMTPTGLVEHRSAPWCAIPELMEPDDAPGEWRLRERPERLPLSFTLQAVKPAAP